MGVVLATCHMLSQTILRANLLRATQLEVPRRRLGTWDAGHATVLQLESVDNFGNYQTS